MRVEYVRAKFLSISSNLLSKGSLRPEKKFRKWIPFLTVDSDL